ncbi:MAG: ABC transporter ATP-binding protein [Planctomycetota bacterium]
MTSDSPPPQEPTQGSVSTPIRVLTRLFEAVGQRCDPAKLAQKCAEAGVEAGQSVDERLDFLAHVGHDLGLRTHTASATVADALKVVRAGQPLVATDEAGTRWLVLVPGRGGRVDLYAFAASGEASAAPEVVSKARAAQIIRELGVEEDTEVHWLVADPATPNEAAASIAESGKTLTNFQRLLRLMAPERSDALVVFIFAVTIGIFSLATPIAVQSIVNSVALGGTLQPLIAVITFLAFALIFVAVLTAIQTWVVELIQRRLFVRAVTDLAARLPRIQADQYEAGYSPERINRFFDVLTIQKAVSKLMIDALGVVLSIVVGLTVLAFYHPFLLAFDVVLLVVIGALVFLPLRRGERTALKESTAKYEVAAWLEEIARNPLTFKTSGSATWIYERADALSRNWVTTRRAHFRTLFTQIGFALALLVIARTALLGIGGFLVIQGSLTLGQLVAAELIVSTVVVSVAKMGKHLETWYDLMAGVAKVGYLLDLPIETSHGEFHQHASRDADGKRPGGHLALLDVSYRAANAPTEIPHADFQVEPGERVLVRGLDGASRLAMVDLIWRLRQPTKGVIRLDGRDLRDLAPDFLRREIAVVSQIEVVHGTVRDNVRLRRPFVQNDNIREALACVGLREVFAEFDGGLDAVMHPDARLLSDDDLRRLMIARALVGDPSVLVIDSCGSGAGQKFRHAINEVLARDDGRTIIVLTNDTLDFDGCDRVIELGPSDRSEPLSSVA